MCRSNSACLNDVGGNERPAAVAAPTVNCTLCNDTRYTCCGCGNASDACTCPNAAPGEAPDRQPCEACEQTEHAARHSMGQNGGAR